MLKQFRAVIVVLLLVGSASVSRAGSIRGILDPRGTLQSSQVPAVGVVCDSCTGTLIDRHWVLTAAHCLKNVGSPFFRIGGMTNENGVSPMLTGQAYIHPQFSASGHTDYRFDIALIRLSNPVDHITPLAFASPNTLLGGSPRLGEKALLVGFGNTGTGTYGEYPASSQSKDKRWGQTSIDAVSPYYSVEKYVRGESVQGRGDSGGPVIVARTVYDWVPDPEYVVTAVNSHFPAGQVGKRGDGTYDTKYGAVFNAVRVDAHANWIETLIYGKPRKKPVIRYGFSPGLSSVPLGWTTQPTIQGLFEAFDDPSLFSTTPITPEPASGALSLTALALLNLARFRRSPIH